MKNYFSKNLKFLRTQKGITQYELADKLEKDYTTIGKWESGQRIPIMLDIIKIADFFNVDINELVSENLALSTKNISINQVKNDINNLSDKDINQFGKDILINMVDYYHEKTKKENKEKEEAALWLKKKKRKKVQE